MTLGLPRLYSYLAYTLLVPPLVTWAGPVIDGQDIPGEFGAGALYASQRFQTGFANDTSGNQWGWGSELDQLYVSNDDTYLYIGLSGNLENNGNCIAVFIDVDSGATGANTLYTKDFGTPLPGLPRFLAGDSDPNHPGFDWMIFDAGFAANYVLGWSGGSPLGSQTRSYYLVNWTTLDANDEGADHSNEVAGVITADDPAASGSPGTLGNFLVTASLGILGGADNSGVDGVEGWDDDPNDSNDCPSVATNDPASQQTGFEFAIPLTLLGVGVDDSVCLLAMVSSAEGSISNQLLPSGETETEFCNIGNRNAGSEALDFGAISGNQFVCHVISGLQGCPNPGSAGKYCEADIYPNNGDGVWSYADDGDCIVGLSDLSQLLANYGMTTGATREDGDISGPEGVSDGAVGLNDLAELLSQYGDNCN